MTHQARFVEFPKFIAVGSISLAALIVPFVFEADGDAVLTETPDGFLQAVVERFRRPFPPEQTPLISSRPE